MLVRVCNICKNQLKKDERYFYINDIDAVYPNVSLKDSINGADICINCAKRLNFSQIFDSISEMQIND